MVSDRQNHHYRLGEIVVIVEKRLLELQDMIMNDMRVRIILVYVRNRLKRSNANGAKNSTMKNILKNIFEKCTSVQHLVQHDIYMCRCVRKCKERCGVSKERIKVSYFFVSQNRDTNVATVFVARSDVFMIMIIYMCVML